MSFTKSPISSGPIYTRTYNSSTVQRSWRCSLKFRMIWAWRAGEIEFQCCFARYVISKRLESRLAYGESKCSLKVTMINSGEKDVHLQESRSAWCGVGGGHGECWWWWRSAEWNWGVQIKAKERRRRLRSAFITQQSIHAEQRQQKREVKSLEWNSGAPNWGQGGDWASPIFEKKCWQKMHYQTLNEISKRQSRPRSVDGDYGVPMGIE